MSALHILHICHIWQAEIIFNILMRSRIKFSCEIFKIYVFTFYFLVNSQIQQFLNYTNRFHYYSSKHGKILVTNEQKARNGQISINLT